MAHSLIQSISYAGSLTWMFLSSEPSRAELGVYVLVVPYLARRQNGTGSKRDTHSR